MNLIEQYIKYYMNLNVNINAEQKDNNKTSNLHQIKNAHLHASMQVLEKSYLKQRHIQNNSQTQYPSRRFNHISFIYKNKFYVQGGTTIPYSQLKDQKNILYCYPLDQNNNKTLMEDQKKQVKDLKQQKQLTKWKIIKTKFTYSAQKQFKVVSGHCCCIYNKKLYVFGGSTNEGVCNNNLFKLDCQTFQWSRSDQKGIIPKERQAAKLFHINLHDKNYLVLYGGFNPQKQQIFNDFCLYQFDIKAWTTCTGHYQNYISPRVNPSMCLKDNKLFLFGGFSINVSDHQNYHDDFYEIKIIPGAKGKQVQSYINVKRLDTVYQNFQKTTPLPRQNASLVPCKEGLILIGGQKKCSSLQITTFEDIWLFTQNQIQKYQIWIKIQITKAALKSRACFSALQHNGDVYLFGGLSTYSNIFSDLLKIHIQSTSQKISRFCLLKKEQYQQKLDCQLCLKIAQDKCFQAKRAVFPTKLIMQAIEGIDFPFSAFGLLVDNSVNHGATFCNITVNDKPLLDGQPVIYKSRYLKHSNIVKSKQKYIRIQDDAQICFQDDQFLTMLKSFQGGVTSFIQGMDKKLKQEARKDNTQRQYGANLKLGCLRLGGEIFHVRYQKKYQKLRVTLIRRQEKSDQSYIQKTSKFPNIDLNNGRFVFYSYSLNRQQLLELMRNPPNLINKRPQQLKKGQFIKYLIQRDQIYSNLLQQAIVRVSTEKCKNIYYIMKLRDVQGQYVDQKGAQKAEFELNVSPYQNDLFYGDIKLIKKLLDRHLPINECIDVSLKTYLTFLYLKCQTKVTLAVPQFQPQFIEIQAQLPKIDIFLKNKIIIQLQNALDFQCKFVQIFFNPDLKKKIKLFCNGLLLYHRNRLINRFDLELGEMLNHIIRTQNRASHSLSNLSHQQYNNYMKLFGYVEVAEAVPINYCKNKFIFEVMMEKLYCRLKFVQKYCEKNVNLVPKKQINTNTNVANSFNTPAIVQPNIKNVKQTHNQNYADKSQRNMQYMFAYQKRHFTKQVLPRRTSPGYNENFKIQHNYTISNSYMNIGKTFERSNIPDIREPNVKRLNQSQIVMKKQIDINKLKPKEQINQVSKRQQTNSKVEDQGQQHQNLSKRIQFNLKNNIDVFQFQSKHLNCRNKQKINNENKQKMKQKVFINIEELSQQQSRIEQEENKNQQNVSLKIRISQMLPQEEYQNTLNKNLFYQKEFVNQDNNFSNIEEEEQKEVQVRKEYDSQQENDYQNKIHVMREEQMQPQNQKIHKNLRNQSILHENQSNQKIQRSQVLQQYSSEQNKYRHKGHQQKQTKRQIKKGHMNEQSSQSNQKQKGSFQLQQHQLTFLQFQYQKEFHDDGRMIQQQQQLPIGIIVLQHNQNENYQIQQQNNKPKLNNQEKQTKKPQCSQFQKLIQQNPQLSFTIKNKDNQQHNECSSSQRERAYSSKSNSKKN